MANSCCGKPITKIIRVGFFEAGIVGLEEALKHVYYSGIDDEEQVKMELLRSVKEFGNYISSGAEDDYKNALIREYRTYITKREVEKKSADR